MIYLLLNVLFLGKCEYEQALKIQYELLRKRQEGKLEDTLILVEHPPVITLGRNAVKENVIASETYLKENGIKTYNINRGGDVTYHGYGQILGYPIINLKEKNIGVKEYVKNIEELFIKLLKDKHNINAERDEEHTGVWVNDNKIVAIGLAVKHYVTMHGFAFNVNTNLDHFNLIVPCGINDKGVTSLQKLKGGLPHNMKTECESVIKYFCDLFDYDNYKPLSINEIQN